MSSNQSNRNPKNVTGVPTPQVIRKVTDESWETANSQAAPVAKGDARQHHPDCAAAYFGFMPGVTCTCPSTSPDLFDAIQKMP